MSIKNAVRNLLWKSGYDVSRFSPTSHPLARRKQILASYGIDTVLDVGANSGQFAQGLRRLGYSGRILSFEPLSTAFKALKANAESDRAWDVFNFAVGDAEAKHEINIAGNSYSSSLLKMLPSHLKSAPESKYIGKETIDVKTIDSLYGDICKTSKHVYLKIDTQGFESKVLKGAENSLKHIGTIQMEMSLVPLYDGEMIFGDMCAYMAAKGYTIIAIESGFSDSASGQLLQVDGIFHRF
jgi:FkbM family methyltransferase